MIPDVLPPPTRVSGGPAPSARSSSPAFDRALSAAVSGREGHDACATEDTRQPQEPAEAQVAETGEEGEQHEAAAESAMVLPAGTDGELPDGEVPHGELFGASPTVTATTDTAGRGAADDGSASAAEGGRRSVASPPAAGARPATVAVAGPAPDSPAHLNAEAVADDGAPAPRGDEPGTPRHASGTPQPMSDPGPRAADAAVMERPGPDAGAPTDADSSEVAPSGGDAGTEARLAAPTVEEPGADGPDPEAEPADADEHPSSDLADAPETIDGFDPAPATTGDTSDEVTVPARHDHGSVRATAPEPVDAGTRPLSPPTTTVTSTTVSTAGPAAPPPPPVTDQLVSHVSPLLDGPDGTHELTIELAPAELGRVRLEVTLDDGVLHVRLHAEDPTSRRLLAGTMGELRATLAQAGIHAGELDVGDGAHRGFGDDGPDHGDPGGQTDRRPRPSSHLSPGTDRPRHATESRSALDVLL